eukprot:TRINITY_DN2972_c0_g1_i5.p1 TRINITY_DN2972_c0_g1~~TRINITY_DN2972_c0_g1_i5.p1  ORF type:complete len:408 (-),score=62.14 TRINITY_DN2972_c0_g1_i5:39-1262(-)
MSQNLQNVTCLDNGSDTTVLCPTCQWGISPSTDPFFCPRCDAALTPLSPKRFGGVAIARHVFAEWQKQTIIPLIRAWFHGTLLEKFDTISGSDCVCCMARSPKSHANRLGGMAIVHHVFRHLLNDRTSPLIAFWFHQAFLAKIERATSSVEQAHTNGLVQEEKSAEPVAVSATPLAQISKPAHRMPGASPIGTAGTQGWQPASAHRDCEQHIRADSEGLNPAHTVAESVPLVNTAADKATRELRAGVTERRARLPTKLPAEEPETADTAQASKGRSGQPHPTRHTLEATLPQGSAAITQDVTPPKPRNSATSALDKDWLADVRPLRAPRGSVKRSDDDQFMREREEKAKRALELRNNPKGEPMLCLLYTSDAADEEDSVDLGGRRIIKKKKKRYYVMSLKQTYVSDK